MNSTSPASGPIDSALAQALLSPRSVALFGASDDPAKTAGRPLKFLRAAGYRGTIYPINPNRDTVQGETAYPSLASLPQVPDQVFVLTPTDTVLDAVRESARLGVKVVTILASGFAESGPEGAAREAELRALSRQTGIRVLGPSSLGVIHPQAGVMLTANAAFAEPELPQGRVFVASHSGSMIGSLVSRGKARGVGFAGLVSVGGEADLSIGEICLATLDDPAIEGYLLFLESLRHGDKLRAFAIEAARRGKPVIAYKLGRSAVAAEMAATHTGALAGEDDIADAFLKDLGIARVGVLEALLEAFPLARRIPLAQPGGQPRVPPRRVGVVTTTGGGAAMVVDQLGIRDVAVEPASPATLDRLAAAGIAVSPGRVLDLTLAGTNYKVMKTALDIMFEAPEFDIVLAVVGSSARFQPQLAVKPIIDSADSAKPLAAMLVPDAPEALAALTAAGVPCFRSPEPCADAIAAVLARRTPGTQPAARLTGERPPRALSEAQAYAVLEQLGVPYAPAITLPIGGPIPALPFDYPVVAKVCSPEIPHKTEVGGVVLGIRDAGQLNSAFATLKTNLAERAPTVRCDEVLVQPMTRGLTEVLVGYRIDPDAGPIVMLAAGGIWAEVARDRSIRLAPVTVDVAREMIAEVKALKTVGGLRGRTRGDLDALARAVSALSQLAVRPELGIAEAEVNPMMVLPEGQGVLAVDALVLTS
ncbi:acetate--CoA ligase family protein [Cupriavidus gilardii]|uniref:acetate--CoA ligase family protein n=1 Tax=Cupriavidus gilardii TaxID=82541 RepID=UPI001580722B|nr:acetate--CoA ligase [Cupriavidus gilardii]MCT9074416.1 acetate--CoA ligase family protein [Cupriavidus gilardii]QKS63526.1 acetate--CoA ligase family protein [Cupriavidus gilardii]